MRWSPWRAAANLPNLHIRLVDLPPECGGGVLVRRASGTWILLDRTAPPERRRAVLAHELVHLEQGPTCRCDDMPRSWDAVVARAERRVDAVVVDRLVPVDELADFVRRRSDVDAVTVSMVADEFAVPFDVAYEACRRLAG